MKRNTLLTAIVATTLLTMSSCGDWWASSTMGPDIYIDDYYGGNYYPGYVGPATPPPPPPPGKPGKPAGNPGRPPEKNPSNRPPENPPANRPDNRPQPKPQQPSNNPGSPAQGGFRGQGSGATSRH